MADGLLTGFRRVTTDLAYDAGQAVASVVSQRHVLAKHTVGLDYDYTAADPTPGTAYGDASHRVARSLIARGMLKGTTQVFFNMPPRMFLHYLEAFQNDGPQTEPTPPAAGASESDRRSELDILYTALGVKNPGQFMLPANQLDRDTLEIAASWATGNELVTGEATGTADASIDGTDVEVFEEFALPESRQAVIGAQPARKAARQHTITAAGDDVELELPSVPRGSEILRAWAVAEADDEVSDTLLTHAGLVIDGEEHFQKLPIAVYQRANVRSMPGLSAVKTGVVFFDFVRDGSAERGKLPRVRSSETPHILGNVAVPGTVNKVYTCVEYVTRP